MGQPAFLITIDTEGDNLWSDSRRITTRNSGFLPRFQQVCEEYGLKPTYLVNYEMARCPVFGRFARDTLRRSAAEIGCHIHAWNSPPDYALTADDLRHKPYLTEYPAEILWAKVAAQTALLEQTFACPITSHRAGRWGFDGEYARAVSHHGYIVDCSVTPGVSWRSSPGKSDGPDYSEAPSNPYFLDFNDVCKPGGSALLEAPMTIVRLWPRADRLRAKLASRSVVRAALNRLMPPLSWLRPNGGNTRAMLRLLRRAMAEHRPYVEFMLHSSELMPGGSPTFQDEQSIDRLYRQMRTLFGAARGRFEPLTLSEFARRYTAEKSAAAGRA
jgi:hypothetical protein